MARSKTSGDPWPDAGSARGTIPHRLPEPLGREEPAGAGAPVCARSGTPAYRVRQAGEVPQAPTEERQGIGQIGRDRAEGSLEAELGSADAAAAPYLTELIRGFNKPNRRMLMILDEAQVLA
jgi:hypothetical protein